MSEINGNAFLSRINMGATRAESFRGENFVGSVQLRQKTDKQTGHVRRFWDVRDGAGNVVADVPAIVTETNRHGSQIEREIGLGEPLKLLRQHVVGAV